MGSFFIFYSYLTEHQTIFILLTRTHTHTCIDTFTHLNTHIGLAPARRATLMGLAAQFLARFICALYLHDTRYNCMCIYLSISRQGNASLAPHWLQTEHKENTRYERRKIFSGYILKQLCVMLCMRKPIHIR